MVMIGYDLYRGGPKDSEKAPNSFLTKTNWKGPNGQVKTDYRCQAYFAFLSPSWRVPSSAACPFGKIDLTKMPMSPRGESLPPTTLKPRPFLPLPFSNTRFWTSTRGWSWCCKSWDRVTGAAAAVAFEQVWSLTKSILFYFLNEKIIKFAWRAN